MVNEMDLLHEVCENPKFVFLFKNEESQKDVITSLITFVISQQEQSNTGESNVGDFTYWQNRIVYYSVLSSDQQQ